MSEPLPAAGGASAGVQLRAARERQGLHVAALAAAIKIPQRKLEALEADRYDELPDATFTRALAMTGSPSSVRSSAPRRRNIASTSVLAASRNARATKGL